VKRSGERPNVDAVLAQLKGFQRDTVDYAFERLFSAPDSSHRFLVADEVGLGKTLVARGLIAKAIDHLWDKADRIDVVYICSNADIARQNINKLNPVRGSMFELASRATLLATTLHDLEKKKVNFVSFTPGTSFELKNSLGRQDERILLCGLLEDLWGDRGTAALNLFQGGVRDKDSFRARYDAFWRENEEIDRKLMVSFDAALRAHIEREKGEGRHDLRRRFNDLCKRFGYARTHIPDEDRKSRNQLIGELRVILAGTCLRTLEPDLVILDEFQRFKHLLAGEDEAAGLARELFDYADHTSRARVLLLSATPYKMYTLYHEQEEDDHYADFLRTVEFLDPNLGRSGMLRSLLSDYRRELYRMGDGGGERLPKIRDQIETSLRRVMARTERVAVSDASDGMLEEIPMNGSGLEVADVRAYVALQHIGDRLEQGNVLEYWKSSPYLLSFMERSGYRLKEELVKRVSEPDVARDIAKSLRDAPEALLPWDRVRAYEPVAPANARLRALLEDCLGEEQWRLLWLPPTLPYHALGPAFEGVRSRGFTKRLLFSTWNMVPKSVAALVSYDAERRIFRAAENDPQNSPEARRKRRGLLRFSRSEGRNTGMPVLGILYPCITFAELVDPLAIAREYQGDGVPSLDALFSEARRRIGPALARITEGAPASGDEDESWYWAAPLLLDRRHHALASRHWFGRRDLAEIWAGAGAGAEEGEAADEAGRSWTQHVAAARRVAEGGQELGRPPRDLLETCVLLALGSPAVCAMRALARVESGEALLRTVNVRAAAARVAWAFRGVFNEPEAMALLRVGGSEAAYWRRVLEYAVGGGLQAVLDEYVHQLRDQLGLFDREPSDAAGELAEAIASALSLRTSSLDVDVIRVGVGAEAVRIETGSMRAHFAARFGVATSEEGKKAQREDQVRAAFNSPFRPFVLVSTSIGQEGLDFHPYCHAVVHWNLPSNPVDLEQREGRVHRYKGHAIRKNVAAVYGPRALRNLAPDPWSQLFEIARREAGDHDHGLVPYWVFATPGGARVERRVSCLPLSSDRLHLEALRRSLAVYRMVFGQPRQDDLLAYLLERLGADQLERYRTLLRIDLSPVQKNRPEEGAGAVLLGPATRATTADN
jgi:hypothetical protein